MKRRRDTEQIESKLDREKYKERYKEINKRCSNYLKKENLYMLRKEDKE